MTFLGVIAYILMGGAVGYPLRNTPWDDRPPGKGVAYLMFFVGVIALIIITSGFDHHIGWVVGWVTFLLGLVGGFALATAVDRRLPPQPRGRSVDVGRDRGDRFE